MTDPVRRRLTLVAVLGALGLLAAAPAASALTSGQRLFGGLLARDARVSAPIKALLRAGGGGFVDPKILIADLTGDRRADAVVLVGSGGAAGNVALYVVSRDGANGRLGNLRVVYAEESGYRLSARVKNAVVTVRAPNYAQGDDVCCPSTLTERDLRWNRRTGAFRLGATRRVAL
jgi:hypothetical protein